MSFGFVEVITLLLGLSGLGVQPNPNAPSADRALEFAIADADLVAHFDAGSVIPGNYKVILQLQNQPQIKASPELQRTVRKMVAELDGARGLLKGTSGIDVTTDVSTATATLRIVPQTDPEVMIAVHGKFTAATIDKIAKLGGKRAVKTRGGSWAETPGPMAVGLTSRGVLLFGTPRLVQDRLSGTWRATAIAPGSNLGHAAELINAKPVFAVSMSLSQGARNDALRELGGQNFVSDLIKRHKVASFAVHRDGVGWTWVDSSRGGLDSMAQMSEGVIDIFRAAQIAPRGFTKIVLGALDSYRGTSKTVDALIRRKSEIERLANSFIGDGQFQARVDKNPTTLTLNVRLTGKSLSEVLPLGGLLPLVSVGAWLAMSVGDVSAGSAPPAVIMPPPPPPSKRAPPPPRTR
jgi:hypothetical protein